MPSPQPTRPPTSFGIALTGSEPWPVVRSRVERLDTVAAISHIWAFDERFNRDPWVTLGLIAATTTRLAFGTCVTDPLVRHPALTGAAAATLAEASGGRAVLGLGAGVSGFASMGIERRAPATVLRETITFLRRFWTDPARFSFNSTAFTWRDGRLHDVLDGVVPIMVAGRGPKVLELAGEQADLAFVATFTDGPLLEHALARVADGIARRPKSLEPLRLGSWVYVSVDDDRETARDAVRQGVATALWGSRPILTKLGIDIPAALQTLMDSVPYAATPDVLGQAAALVPDELIDTCSVAGTPADCVAGLKRLQDRGFDHLAMWPFQPAHRTVDDVLDRLINDVIPVVATHKGERTDA